MTAQNPRRGLTAALVAAAALVAVTLSPPSALGGPSPQAFGGHPIVDNDGPVTFTGTGGAFWLEGEDPLPLDPECSNGLDDDDDGDIDWPDDAECASPYDQSEEERGDQALTLAGEIDEYGNIDIPQEGVNIPDKVMPLGGPWGLLDITVKTMATADATGHLNPITGAAHLDLALKIKLKHLFWLFKSCSTYVTLHLTTGPSGELRGFGYSAVDGTSGLVENDFSVPELDDCGIYTDWLNGEDGLDLPKDPGEAGFIIDTLSDPILKPPPGWPVLARHMGG